MEPKLAKLERTPSDVPYSLYDPVDLNFYRDPHICKKGHTIDLASLNLLRRVDDQQKKLIQCPLCGIEYTEKSYRKNFLVKDLTDDMRKLIDERDELREEVKQNVKRAEDQIQSLKEELEKQKSANRELDEKFNGFLQEFKKEKGIQDSKTEGTDGGFYKDLDAYKKENQKLKEYTEELEKERSELDATIFNVKAAKKWFSNNAPILAAACGAFYIALKVLGETKQRERK